MLSLWWRILSSLDFSVFEIIRGRTKRETACWDLVATSMVAVGSGDVRRDVEGGPVGDVMNEAGEIGLVVLSACVCSGWLGLGKGSL